MSTDTVEQKAGLAIELALKFNDDINKELKRLQQSDSPRKASVRRVLLAMIKLVKSVVINLINLFEKKHAFVNEPAKSKEIHKIIHQLNSNLPSWLDRLKLSLRGAMVAADFSKLKTKVGEQKSTISAINDENATVIVKR